MPATRHQTATLPVAAPRSLGPGRGRRRRRRGAGQVADLDAAEVLTTEEQDRRLAEPVRPQLAGVTEVAELLGVTRGPAAACRQPLMTHGSRLTS